MLRLLAERVGVAPDGADLVAALTRPEDEVVWLDSGPADRAEVDGRGRWSILALPGGPFGAALVHRDGAARLLLSEVSRAWFGAVASGSRGCFAVLEDLLAALPRVPEPEPDCGFALGWVGYVGYEVGREVDGPDRADGAAPGAQLRFVDRAVVTDLRERATWVLALVDDTVPEASAANTAWARDAMARVAALDAGREARPATGTPRASATGDPSVAPQRVRSGGDHVGDERWSGAPAPCLPAVGRTTRAAYEAAVASCREEIRHGRAFQVCLTTAFAVPGPRRPGPLTDDGLSAALFAEYRTMREVDAVPFGSFLRLGEHGGAGSVVVVASRSPERFLRVSAGGEVVSEPVKGTAARRPDPLADEAARSTLAASVKDRAENVMVVDLVRNDLHRTVRPAGVRVDRLCALETYATVHQLVSTVVADLEHGASRVAVVRGAFPPGSMTGTPKRSATAIADRLEGAARGVYSGAVGYWSLSGAVDLAVAIRTLVTVCGADGAVRSRTFGAGGAVTWGSTPAGEADEVEAKTRGVLGAIGVAVAW